MKNIIISVLNFLAASLVIFTFSVSCSKWTEPKNLDFRRKTIEQENPEKYDSYLEDLRDYKESEHKIMVVTMKGVSDVPSSQSQHIMAMPDSADYICVDVVGNLNNTIAKEIPQVRQKKGTKVLLLIDYERINKAWGLLEDARSDKGQKPATMEEMIAFFKEKTNEQLENCKKYGFDGLMVSYHGNTSTPYAEKSQIAYISSVKEFYTSNPDLILAFRGSARNIVDMDFLKEFKFITIIAGEEKKLSVLPGRILGRYAPKDRVVMELTVPSLDDPKQKGVAPIDGASWVLSEKNEEYTILGLSVFNAQDDYFCKQMSFKNIRKAISKMNSREETNE